MIRTCLTMLSEKYGICPRPLPDNFVTFIKCFPDLSAHFVRDGGFSGREYVVLYVVGCSGAFKVECLFGSLAGMVVVSEAKTEIVCLQTNTGGTVVGRHCSRPGAVGIRVFRFEPARGRKHTHLLLCLGHETIDHASLSR